ncbi:ribonucleotide reductase subunit alpha [Porticoccaceae bacterium LTM1]|nr:ribonucleotide reductase subunit alpha [Porticoccaceae bacterium LTM1]
MISMFQDLLDMTSEQPEPQRLLFLFASTDITRKSRKQDEKSGTITPTMVVDKLPSEITGFDELVKEADSINKEWDFVFIAALSGENNKAPSSEDAEVYLNRMTNDVASGNNIHRYVVFDRNQNPIEIMPH